MLSAWNDHAHWTIGIRANDGLSAAQSIQSNGCGSTSTTQSSGFQLFGSVHPTGQFWVITNGCC
jgi:hypothetical protein